MATVRKADGSIVETTLAGTPGPTPVTPAGTAAAGGTPDQAKMSGTPAQKAPVLAEAVKPQDTLQAQSRQTPQPAPAAGSDVQAKDLAGRLATFGAYGSRIKAAVQAKIDAVSAQAPLGAAALQLSPTALDKFTDPDKRAKVEAALKDYAAAPTDAKLKALGALTGEDPTALAGGGIKAYFGGEAAAAQAVEAAAKVDPTAITMGSLDWSDTSKFPVPQAQLAQDLGVTPEALASMTPDQFQQAVDGAVARELNTGKALRAEYITASPQRREQIRAEIRAQDASGVQAAELAAHDLQSKLDAQETVTIGGEDYDVSEVLGDDGLSKLITNAVNSPDALAELAKSPETAALAAWISTNLESLKDVTLKAVDETATAFDATQAAVTTATAELPPELQATFGLPAGPLTAEQLATFQAQLKDDPVYKAMLADETGALKRWLTEDPRLVAKLKSLPEDQWPALLANKQAWDTTDQRWKDLITGAGLRPDSLTHSPMIAAALTSLNAMGVSDIPAFTAALGKAFATPTAMLKLLKDPVQLDQVTKSYALINDLALTSDAAANAALRKLWGVPKGAAFSTTMTPKEMAKVKGNYDLLVKAVGAVPGDSAGTRDALAALVADGTLNTVAEMKAAAANPALLTEIVEDRQTQASLDAVTKLMSNPKTVAKGQDAVAALILGKGATFSGMVNELNAANAVLASPKKYDALALTRAKKLLGKFKDLDTDGNGKVNAADFMPNGDPGNYSDAEWAQRSGAHFAKVAKMLGRVTGVDSADTLLAGTAGTPNSLKPVQDFWADLRGSWGTKFSTRYPAASTTPTGPADTSALDGAKVAMDSAYEAWQSYETEQKARVASQQAGQPNAVPEPLWGQKAANLKHAWKIRQSEWAKLRDA